MIDRVERALGRKYPENPDALVLEYKTVIGPFLAELRERFNNLRFQTGFTNEENAAAITALDVTEMPLNMLAVDSEFGDVYALKLGSPGAGDLPSVTAGYYWAYEYPL